MWRKKKNQLPTPLQIPQKSRVGARAAGTRLWPGPSLVKKLTSGGCRYQVGNKLNMEASGCLQWPAVLFAVFSILSPQMHSTIGNVVFRRSIILNTALNCTNFLLFYDSNPEKACACFLLQIIAQLIQKYTVYLHLCCLKHDVSKRHAETVNYFQRPHKCYNALAAVPLSTSYFGPCRFDRAPSRWL